jgi:hypothetical protein
MNTGAERSVAALPGGPGDRFWRRHPALLFASVVVLACVVSVLLLAGSEGPVVLYQRF